MRSKLVLSRWMVMASLAAISFVIGGACVVAIGLFMTPMMLELRWSSVLTSSAATTFSLAAFLAAPGVGVTLDKLGAPAVMTFGTLLVSAGFLLASHCHTPYVMLPALALAGIGYCASFYVPTAVVVTNWMGSRKSVGMGIIWGALSIGAALFSVMIGWWIEAYGWRVTSEIIALLAVVMLPLILVTIRTCPPRSLHERYSGSSSIARAGRALRASLFSTPFMVATVSSGLYAIGTGCIAFHVVSVLIKAGYPTSWAGLVLGASWVLSALGSLVIGGLAERLGVRATFAGCQCSCAVGALFLLGAGQATTGVSCVVAFLILWGMPANGVGQLIPVIFVERFGSQHLGTLIGVQSSVLGIAGAAAPILTGLLYDRFNSYRLAIYLSAFVTVLGFVVALLIDVSKHNDILGLAAEDVQT